MATLNEEKYRNAILYFVQHISNSTLGKVKLMKLLYYLDFDHFEKYGILVTGDRYRAWQMGPVPVSADIVMRDMVLDGLLTIQYIDVGMPNPKTQYVPRRAFNIHVFSAEEAETLLSVTEKWEHHSTRDMVHATHGDPPWMKTPFGEFIDPSLVYLREIKDMDADDSGEPKQEDAMQLTPEEQALRAKGFALVARTEEYVRAHPEFNVAMETALAEIEAGEYDSFDQDGWHDR